MRRFQPVARNNSKPPPGAIKVLPHHYMRSIYGTPCPLRKHDSQRCNLKVMCGQWSTVNATGERKGYPMLFSLLFFLCAQTIVWGWLPSWYCVLLCCVFKRKGSVRAIIVGTGRGSKWKTFWWENGPVPVLRLNHGIALLHYCMYDPSFWSREKDQAGRPKYKLCTINTTGDHNK